MASFAALSSCLYAQQGGGSPVLRENSKNELIIVFPDGRWQYFNRYQSGDGSLFDPGDNPNAPSQEREALERYPVFTGKVVPFEHTVAVTDEDAQKMAVRQAQIARSAVGIAEERAAGTSQQRVRLETELAARRGRAGAEEIRQLEIRLEAAKRAEAAAKREAYLAQQEAGRADQFVTRGNYAEELRQAQQKKLSPGAADELLSGNFYDQIAALDNGPSLFAGAPAVPASQSCHIAFDGTDEFTGMRRRDVGKQLLFAHTDDRLRLYLKDKDYLRCEGYMTSLAGGYRYLSLEFTFAYPNAAEAYGFIEKGSYLVIKLLDGQAVYLQSGKMDRGSYDTVRELLTYRVHYPINPGVISTLRRGEVDTIRMFWSSGFEEYEVYNLNFFINQIACLEE